MEQSLQPMVATNEYIYLAAVAQDGSATSTHLLVTESGTFTIELFVKAPTAILTQFI
jgi:hypothetical protein